MAKYEKLIDFKISVPDRPGELAAITGRLKEVGLSLRGMWGFGLGGGRGEIICLPEDPEAFREFVRVSELEATERTVVFATGADRLGEVLKLVDELAEAHIDVHSLDAMSLQGHYGAYIRVDEDQVEAVMQALERLDTNA